MSIGNEDDSSNAPTESVTRNFFSIRLKSSQVHIRNSFFSTEKASAYHRVVEFNLVEFTINLWVFFFLPSKIAKDRSSVFKEGVKGRVSFKWRLISGIWRGYLLPLRLWESTNIYSFWLDALHQPFYVEFSPRSFRSGIIQMLLHFFWENDRFERDFCGFSTYFSTRCRR